MSPRKLPELPDNVIRPDVWKGTKRKVPPRRKRLHSKTTACPDFQRCATSENAENVKPDTGLQGEVWSFQEPVPQEVWSKPANRKDASRAEFERQVASLSAMGLRHRFKAEATSHRLMMGRRHEGAIVHPAFEDFRSFLLHVGPRRSPNLTLDRLDTYDPEYGPGKVAWRDKTQQANNRKTTLFFTARGETLPVSDWARRTGQKAKTIRERYYRGWTPEEAIFGRTDQPSAASSDPSLDAAPTEAVGYPWPGSQPHLWEAAFRTFVAFAETRPYLAPYEPRKFTRDAFLAWIGGNIVADAGRRMAARYPGYGQPSDDPEALEPAEARADPLYRRIEVLRWPSFQAGCRVTSRDDPAHHLYRDFLRKLPDVFNFQKSWATVFAKGRQRA